MATPGVILQLPDGKTLKVEWAQVEDLPAELDRLRNREGEYADGWVTAKSGDLVNLDYVVRIQPVGF